MPINVKLEPYQSRAAVVTLKFASRASVKIRDNYFTFEACEEWQLPADGSDDVEKERELLWQTVNGHVDAQLAEVGDSVK